ncbi:hypothetical protein [Bacillus multifaciens]|uniref:hypothetical protein n=1 Tax=Bacillus multifaciens TaxID=3068506 RepID=UPI0027403843|nr:hypothetical protein [Bacillus sp. WLY-B-L8]MDP7979126.1 hypothetical protein [Bacillus sp. WLY-B-L8]
MVKIDFDKVMIVFGMGWQLWTNGDLIFPERLTLRHMYQQLNCDEKECLNNEYKDFISYLSATE